MAEFNVKIEVEGMETFKSLVRILKEVIVDQRIPDNVRNEYIDKIDVIMEEIK